MSARRPRNPWRVIVTGSEVNGTATGFGSETAAHAFVRVCLGPGSPAAKARVEHWEDGRWWHFETVNAEGSA